MHNLLLSLYDTLGLELDEDEPMLLIDDDIGIYFDEIESGLEMVCPIGPLPLQADILIQLLQFNYQGRMIAASNAESDLLIILRFDDANSTSEMLLTGLEHLAGTARSLKNYFAHGNQTALEIKNYSL